MSSYIHNGTLINGMLLLGMGWTVSVQYRVLVNGRVTFRDVVLEYGMGSQYMVWGVSKQD